MGGEMAVPKWCETIEPLLAGASQRGSLLLRIQVQSQPSEGELQAALAEVRRSDSRAAHITYVPDGGTHWVVISGEEVSAQKPGWGKVIPFRRR